MKIAIAAAVLFSLVFTIFGIIVCIVQDGALLKTSLKECVLILAMLCGLVALSTGLAALGYWIGGFLIR